MRFYFHPKADEEFDQAERYYEDCEPGLGLEFAEEVYATVAQPWTISSVTRRMVKVIVGLKR